jgi:glutamine amidotransferase
MCRFVAYFGQQSLVLDQLIGQPENSLINQSRFSHTDGHRLNADGFGLAWYDKSLATDPGLFKSIQPAWNDENLKYLARHIQSKCFLGHIRASTVGDVYRVNCHPFTYQNFAFVHNGTIRPFTGIRRAMINQLDEPLYLQIKGQTDSECLFYLVMQYYQQHQNLVMAVGQAIDWVVAYQQGHDEKHFSRLNLVMTDGEQLIGIRFASKNNQSLSFHYLPTYDQEQLLSLTISSKPLTQGPWLELSNQQYLYISRQDMQLQICNF